MTKSKKLFVALAAVAAMSLAASLAFLPSHSLATV